MTLVQSLILAVIQGVTEFIPVSSSGHLNLTQALFGLYPSLSFDVFLHAATLLSVIFFFRFHLRQFFDNFLYVFIGSLPAAIIGFFLKNQIDSFFSTPSLLPLFFLVTAILLFSTKFLPKNSKKITPTKALIIGLFQALALIPGISRSAATICSALFLGLDPISAFNFSFYLFIPATFGAVFFSFREASHLSLYLNGFLPAFILALIVGLVSLHLLRRLVSSRSVWLFGFYTLILSLLSSFLLS